MRASFFILILAVAGALMALWVLGKGEGEPAQTDPAIVDQAVDSLPGTESSPEPETSTPEIQIESESIRAPMQPRNPDVTAWLQRSGFTTEYNMHFLDSEFLERQAAAGNMLAVQTLGYQTLGSRRSFELLTDAARWGSIQALHWISSASEFVAYGRLKEQRQAQVSEQDQHEYSIKALEYLFVAEMRGDTYAAPTSIARLLDCFSYTESDVSQACHQARYWYATLEQSRIAEGMPAFDNDPPAGLAVATNFRQHCPP